MVGRAVIFLPHRSAAPYIIVFQICDDERVLAASKMFTGADSFFYGAGRGMRPNARLLVAFGLKSLSELEKAVRDGADVNFILHPNGIDHDLSPSFFVPGKPFSDLPFFLGALRMLDAAALRLNTFDEKKQMTVGESLERTLIEKSTDQRNEEVCVFVDEMRAITRKRERGLEGNLR